MNRNQAYIKLRLYEGETFSTKESTLAMSLLTPSLNLTDNLFDSAFIFLSLPVLIFRYLQIFL